MTQQSETEQITLLIEQGSTPLLKSACACHKFLLTSNSHKLCYNTHHVTQVGADVLQTM